jgi:hypothetical protein
MKNSDRLGEIVEIVRQCESMDLDGLKMLKGFIGNEIKNRQNPDIGGENNED